MRRRYYRRSADDHRRHSIRPMSKMLKRYPPVAKKINRHPPRPAKNVKWMFPLLFVAGFCLAASDFDAFPYGQLIGAALLMLMLTIKQ